jgi:hypothetical protein
MSLKKSEKLVVSCNVPYTQALREIRLLPGSLDSSPNVCISTPLKIGGWPHSATLCERPLYCNQAVEA